MANFTLEVQPQV